jgi:hypothetical protein
VIELLMIGAGKTCPIALIVQLIVGSVLPDIFIVDALVAMRILAVVEAVEGAVSIPQRVIGSLVLRTEALEFNEDNTLLLPSVKRILD